jgi:hypothetical protein
MSISGDWAKAMGIARLISRTINPTHIAHHHPISFGIATMAAK